MKRISPILTAEEKAEFAECDKVVQETTPAVQRWGDALIAIKEKSLWRGSFDSFEHYLEKRVGWTPQHANRLIKAARFRTQQLRLAERGEAVTVPETEHAARIAMAEAAAPITPADLPRVAEPPADIRSSTDNVRSNTDTTVNQTSEPVGSNSNCPVDKQAESSPKTPEKPLSKQYADSKGRDKGGYPIPKQVFDTFDTWHELQELANKLSNIEFHIQSATRDKKLGWKWLNAQDWLAKFGDLIRELRAAEPAHVCPYCQGRNFDTCLNCRGTGVVTAFFYERQADKDMVRFREIAVAQLSQ